MLGTGGQKMANEKRYIDANALCDRITATFPPMSANAMCVAIENAPTVDAVEVPCRCKKCKYWRHYEHLGCTEYVKVCTLANYMIGENGYCLYGERREGE